MLKNFVCLAKSIRNGGVCIAGKEYSHGVVGPWFRPVGRKQDALSSNSCSFNVGDIVSCRVNSHTPTLPQYENYKLSPEPSWSFVDALPHSSIERFLDSPQTLWATGSGCSSTHGTNDRVPEFIARSMKNSLYFVPITNAQIVKKDESFDCQRSKLRLVFQYHGANYSLPVTTPNLSNRYWSKLQIGESDIIKKCYITISLTMPFYGHCYKLVAGYVPA